MVNEQLREWALSLVEEVNGRLSRVQPLVLILGSVAGTVVVLRVRRLLNASDLPLHKRLIAYGFSWLRLLPAVQRKIEGELQGTKRSLLNSIHECDKDLVFVKALPYDSSSTKQIVAKAARYSSMNQHFDVLKGRVSGSVYTNLEDEGHLNVLIEVFRRYAYSNPLHPEVFPGCRKMEAEVVRIVANLFNGPPGSCGTMTNGGTESIILACLAYRNRALSKGINDPVILAPSTAHAAFDKAASLLGIRIRHVPIDEKTSEVDIRALKKAITSNTCMLVGSVPNFPFGTMDNIEAISELGLKYDIPVHVDACLGGFLIAFAKEAGFELPPFDFRLPGVTSVSCDTHKYGYAPKGTSTILYRSADYLHHQYFSVTEWSGGIYATPTLGGSRAGLNIALTWATLLHFGRKEYVDRTKKILGSARRLASAIEKLPGFELVGRPDVSVVAFRSVGFNIYAVADRLNKLGWNLNTLQLPDSIHFCLTYNQTVDKVINAFISDLRSVGKEVSQLNTKGNDSQTAAIYGMVAQVPDKSLIDEVAYLYLDACYAMPEKH